MPEQETPNELLPLIASGAQVVVRDEEWLVRSVRNTPADGKLVSCIGTSTLVKDTEATFFTKLDVIQPLKPEDTKLVADDSPRYRDTRLYLEAMIRKTPIAATESGLTVSNDQLLDKLDYQRRAVHKALDGLRPRLLIADAVGLGKTLEVGMILSELIRRGRGDKILVVTPRHILEQFQHELWTRFAIPLVRLDSVGIQRVRQQIPANRNPFTYYKRSIISIDTLKNAGRYRHHLEGIRWDAVVIDECHNLVNRGTLNNQLAHVLAPRTEALLLTSATPHNGDPESFAELIRLLDPTAVAEADDLKEADISHLYVRRHKGHDEVKQELSTEWADRLPPKPVLVEASPAENELFRELADTWTHPRSGQAPVTGQGRSLFPWTLFKSALSSHHALAQTIETRRKNLAKNADAERGLNEQQQTEDDALATLHDRCAAIDGASASKLNALIEQLTDIGVSKKKTAPRAVIFSERIATLDWLAATLSQALGLDPVKHVRVLHGGMADIKQMDVIEEFGLAGSPVKLLLTGDMASEGVNLHRQCNHLIHFDLPWSLITIEQRNGRIDRYGQTKSPDIRAMILQPDHDACTGDIRVLSRLLEREDHAHRQFGDSGSLLGLGEAKLEEEAIARVLRDGQDVDQAIPDAPAAGTFDMLTLVGGATGRTVAPIFDAPSLFTSNHEFVTEALGASFDDAHDRLELGGDPHDETFMALNPPADLQRRFRALPQQYLREQNITERLKITADTQVANDKLSQAHNDDKTNWPAVSYLSPLHPFVEWLTDKVLVTVGRNEAPAIVANVDQPTFCIQGMHSNGRGQPQLVEWMAVRFDGSTPVVSDLFDALKAANVAPNMINPGIPLPLEQTAALVPAAVDAARAELDARRAAHDQVIEDRLAEPTARLVAWTNRRHTLSTNLDNEKRRRDADRHTSAVRTDTTELIESLRTKGQPLVRVLAVLMPGGAR